MAQWYIKDIAKLTQVSIQTLHHYDRIDLLKPSVRLDNGYRLYSEKDLLRLQQIIALKFFGFELTQIKMLLKKDELDMLDHFTIQSTLLAEKAQKLLEASNALKNILAASSLDKSIPWGTIIQLIEVYRMTEKLENAWVSKALTAEELKEYASFERELKTRFTESEKAASENEWFAIVKDVNANLEADPKSELGWQLGKRCMDWVNKTYGKKHATLRSSLWEKGFKAGYAEGEHGLTREAVHWLDEAIDTYYRRRIYDVLNQAETNPNAEALWKALMTDMFGDNPEPKAAIVVEAMKDEKVSSTVKNWLKKIS